MARRRRAVERAALRRTAIDRVVTGVLVVVVASGLMSVLPGSSQRAVSRTSCRLATLGLGTCGDPGLDLTDAALAPPRCLLLARFDDALPEVRVRRLVAARGLPVTVSTARSGDVVVQLGDAPQPPLPAVLAGAVRPQRAVAPGVEVPAQAEWYLPRGQGLEELVGAVQDSTHKSVQRRSALGLLGAALDRDGPTVPGPTLLSSSLDLRQPVWPRPGPQQPRPPKTGAGPTPSPGPTRTGSSVQVRVDEPAVSVFNRITRQSELVVGLTGSLGARSATGTLRVTRDATGTIVSVLLAVVTPGPAVPGEPRTSLPGPAVAYVSIPVQTPTERELVEGWLSGSAAAVVPLDVLLGLRPPSADDRLESFLARAATVTVLRYGLVDPAELARRIRDELRDGRREDWIGIRLVEAAEVDPTSSGAGRVLVADPACRT